MTLILNGTNGLSDVDGSAATPAIRGTDSNTGIFFPAADTIAFAEGGAEIARFDSSGNLGIGTSSPSSRLTIGTGTYSAAASGTTGMYTTATGLEVLSDSYLFGTRTGSIRMVIDSSGSLLVGTTDNGQSSGAGVKIFPNSWSTTGISIVNAANTNSDLAYRLYSTGAGAYRFYVGYGGTVYATNTTISSLSDQRHKENIRDLDVGLDKIMALKPRLYDWKEGKGADIKNARGFIAQEFETVFPDLIDEWLDPAPEGEEPYKSVRADLIPVLVKAIQEQQAIITQLQADVAALKAQP